MGHCSLTRLVRQTVAVDRCYRAQPFPNETKRIEFLFDLYDKSSGMFANKKKEKEIGALLSIIAQEKTSTIRRQHSAGSFFTTENHDAYKYRFYGNFLKAKTDKTALGNLTSRAIFAIRKNTQSHKSKTNYPLKNQ